ncbi:VWA domain-containing protein [Candidatus Paraluminiphilus aquimaris]|uniref:VWA domain-containing protein n=1 Tax=Candidatus Paraluminiphilus aquimaris TaxID=2518994 RepID=A0ABY6Q640_9GAMM|nr:VWA domain-containing protein [Candidatus Paraluminiphilus aquimaris]UZP74000.1 VWA domain-containing protein [Candidatus Paraluminiphilus aquimaris]
MPKRRPTPEISLSFLDVICCGFGAVILLLMITKTVEPQVLEESTVIAEGRVAELTEQLFEIRGETTVLNRDLAAKQEQISEFEEQIAILQGALASSKSRYDSLQTTRNANSIVEAQLAIARQELSEEEERLLGRDAERKNQLIGGIPVDSEYIIFIIDTSGSMFSYAWDRMLREMEATLNIYPNVKGIQVMNDMGNYLFSRYAGQWIPDTPARRQLILRNLANWNAFSNSSPVEGITQAVRSFYDRDKKISIYVFGDEFTGRSIEDVVLTVDKLNAEARTGERRVRIHAVGFPVQFIRPPELQDTGIRFATLMRELTHRNGGTFVGLNDFRP